MPDTDDNEDIGWDLERETEDGSDNEEVQMLTSAHTKSLVRLLPVPAVALAGRVLVELLYSGVDGSLRQRGHNGEVGHNRLSTRVEAAMEKMQTTGRAGRAEVGTHGRQDIDGQCSGQAGSRTCKQVRRVVGISGSQALAGQAGWKGQQAGTAGRQASEGGRAVAAGGTGASSTVLWLRLGPCGALRARGVVG
ncbi:hypothetical protein GGX14DRAFT_396683 [Mycena pura]|uniref:Uncharacterized protein n=1 Tax=Mycena pura TaxID=153505 RepID=A0AAD6VCH6_9AGAR|nr:hypothetical protein GGX14DRAFT_396683 [Mycena pura]